MSQVPLYCGSRDYITSGCMHSLISSDNMLSSEILVDEMIHPEPCSHNFHLSYNISKIGSNKSLNVLDVKMMH